MSWNWIYSSIYRDPTIVINLNVTKSKICYINIYILKFSLKLDRTDMTDCGFLDILNFLNVCIRTRQEDFSNDSKILLII